MTRGTDTSTKTSEVELDTRRRAAAVALGLDPSIIAWPDRRDEHEAASGEVKSERPHLTDAEWRSLAPLLPAEAPQAKAMSNREFLKAVLEAMQRNGWVSRKTPAADIEAARRRFGRWAHAEVFQGLAAALPGLDLSPETARLLQLAAKRARQLKARAAR
jgi:transposase